jgi:hypothetical protein
MLSIVSNMELELDAARELAERAVALATEANERRAVMMAQNILAAAALERGDEAFALPHLEQVYELSGRIGSRMFELSSRIFHTRYLAWMGRREDAWTVLRLAREAERHSGFNLMGTALSGLELMLVETETERRAILDDLGPVVETSRVFHTYFWFYESAIEALLLAGDIDGAERYLEAFARQSDPPSPRIRFSIERGRALARWYRSGPSDEGRRELERLRDFARSRGAVLFLPHIDRALADGAGEATAAG